MTWGQGDPAGAQAEAEAKVAPPRPPPLPPRASLTCPEFSTLYHTHSLTGGKESDLQPSTTVSRSVACSDLFTALMLGGPTGDTGQGRGLNPRPVASPAGLAGPAGSVAPTPGCAGPCRAHPSAGCWSCPRALGGRRRSTPRSAPPSPLCKQTHGSERDPRGAPTLPEYGSRRGGLPAESGPGAVGGVTVGSAGNRHPVPDGRPASVRLCAQPPQKPPTGPCF